MHSVLSRLSNNQLCLWSQIRVSVMWLNVILYAVIMAGWKVYQQELFVYNEDAVHFTPIGISLLIWALSLVVIDVLVSKETVRRIDMHALSKAELNEMAKPLSLRSMLKKMTD
ncbi:hypothetical protein [Vibrio breoganii]|uniref:hypothetical protein n=1 Tax=Vibrio breoganii TaxID=553239 RepID=UPI00105689FC|nr:hypothetical protein [Vibrio breoganii]